MALVLGLMKMSLLLLKKNYFTTRTRTDVFAEPYSNADHQTSEDLPHKIPFMNSSTI
jgi:hypothetical protein